MAEIKRGPPGTVHVANDLELYLRSVREGMYENSDLAIYVASPPGAPDPQACITFTVSDTQDGPIKRAQLTLPWRVLREVMRATVESIDESGNSATGQSVHKDVTVSNKGLGIMIIPPPGQLPN